jgi:Tfp pilus assembly protein PilO
MMKVSLIILLVMAALLAGVYFYYDRIIVRQPQELEDMIAKIEEKNKQLLAAQILAEKRGGVTMLIHNNLVESPQDSLAEKASIPFLRFLTSSMDRLGIRLVSLTPQEVLGTEDPVSLSQKEYIEVPYEMKLIASYQEFGKFLDVLEKSPHLIKVNGFTISNDIEQSSFSEEIVGKPRQHPIHLTISTLAILKASYKGESEQSY